MKSPITFMHSATLAEKQARLEEIIRPMESALVAFSGGADSALLLRVTHDVLGARAVGAIAISASIAPKEIDGALAVAQQMGVTLHMVKTREFENEAYLANNSDRCYHCKMALFDALEPLAVELGLGVILYGANHDDLGDFRPGQAAARKRGARAPLLEAGFTKFEVRELSRRLGLSTWHKPAMACLSSRIPHGTAIEPETLSRIAEAEAFLRQLGITQVRVRTYGTTARIETDADSIAMLAEPDTRQRTITVLKELGYEFITLDLEGFQSGSMNPKSQRPSRLRQLRKERPS